MSKYEREFQEELERPWVKRDALLFLARNFAAPGHFTNDDVIQAPMFAKAIATIESDATQKERERCANILRSVDNYANPMTANDCLDAILAEDKIPEQSLVGLL